MKLKNELIVALANHGVLNITTTTIDAAHAYKVMKFRRAVTKAFGKLQEAEMAIVRECGLNVTDKGELTGKAADKERFGKLRAELYNDTTDIDDIKTIPYNSWHALQQENHGLADAYIEDNLEGILWQSDENDTDSK